MDQINLKIKWKGKEKIKLFKKFRRNFMKVLEINTLNWYQFWFYPYYVTDCLCAKDLKLSENFNRNLLIYKVQISLLDVYFEKWIIELFCSECNSFVLQNIKIKLYSSNIITSEIIFSEFQYILIHIYFSFLYIWLYV